MYLIMNKKTMTFLAESKKGKYFATNDFRCAIKFANTKGLQEKIKKIKKEPQFAKYNFSINDPQGWETEYVFSNGTKLIGIKNMQYCTTASCCKALKFGNIEAAGTEYQHFIQECPELKEYKIVILSDLLMGEFKPCSIKTGMPLVEQQTGKASNADGKNSALDVKTAATDKNDSQKDAEKLIRAHIEKRGNKDYVVCDGTGLFLCRKDNEYVPGGMDGNICIYQEKNDAVNGLKKACKKHPGIFDSYEPQKYSTAFDRFLQHHATSEKCDCAWRVGIPGSIGCENGYVITNERDFLGQSPDGQLTFVGGANHTIIFDTAADAKTGLKLMVRTFPGIKGYRYTKIADVPLFLTESKDERMKDVQQAVGEIASCVAAGNANHKDICSSIPDNTDIDSDNAEKIPDVESILKDLSIKANESGKNTISVVTDSATESSVDEMMYAFAGRLDEKYIETKRQQAKVEKTLIDIYHFVEFSDFTINDVKMLYYIYIMFRTALRDRRRIKDDLDKLTKTMPVRQSVSETIHLFQNMQPRNYVPRIANELFEKLIRNDGRSSHGNPGHIPRKSQMCKKSRGLGSFPWKQNIHMAKSHKHPLAARHH